MTRINAFSTSRPCRGRATVSLVSSPSRRPIAPMRQNACSLAVLPARPLTTEILSGRDTNPGSGDLDTLIDRLSAITDLLVRPTQGRPQVRAGRGRSRGHGAVSPCRRRARHRLSSEPVTGWSCRCVSFVRRMEACRGARRFDQPVADVTAVADAVAHDVCRAFTVCAPGRLCLPLRFAGRIGHRSADSPGSRASGSCTSYSGEAGRICCRPRCSMCRKQ